jgi:hypothetical protein
VKAFDLVGTDVLREFNRIDLLIVNEPLDFAVIVENKVGTGEHDDQLRRYWDSFRASYPRITKILGVFLSPDGSIPSDPRYIPLRYSAIAEVVEAIRESNYKDLGADLSVLLRHYSDLLRREFMGDQKAEELAWTIHRNYSEAVTFIARSDPIAQVRNHLRNSIKEAKDLTYDSENSGEIRFTLPEWEQNPLALDPSGKSAGWLFWFDDFHSDVKLRLGANPEVIRSRDSLLKAAASDSRLFSIDREGKDTGGWPTVWIKFFLKIAEISRLDRQVVFGRIDERWRAFSEKDLPRIRAALLKASD